jgi:hypothetical protein
MKKDRTYDSILRNAEHIHVTYAERTEWISTKLIHVRASKIEPRIRIENPETQEIVSMEYKPLHEIILPQPIPIEIQQLLEKKTEVILPKQWKTKQIYEFIQENRENEYKTYCEQHNTVQPTWNESWITFVLLVKGKSYTETKPIIRAFVENLRRIRHIALCAKDIVEREDREQWQSITVVRAFLEGKIDKFKIHNETHESPEDPKWIKRWDTFIASLKQHRSDESVLKDLCSKFMTAQRTKKYRASKNMLHNGT